MDNENVREVLKRQRFVGTNGRILRTLNLLEIKERRVYNLYFIMKDVPAPELLNSLEYLSQSGYIKIQHKNGLGCIGDDPLACCVPVNITAAGMELLMGLSDNPAVEV